MPLVLTRVTPERAVQAARARRVVLPEVYYGELQGLARSLAHSIAGVSSLDQIEAVRDTLAEHMEAGGTFRDWQELVRSDEIGLDLPDHRLDNIFRTNVQSSYMRGRCEAIRRSSAVRPYLMYSAVNDSRTRPSHAALDSFVARADDPVWQRIMPPNGYRCRCTVIQLSEAQAQRFMEQDQARIERDPGLARIRDTALADGLDPGWDYSVCSEPDGGVARSIGRRQDQCGGTTLANRRWPPLWCTHPPVRDRLAELEAGLPMSPLADRVRDAIGRPAFQRYLDPVRQPAQGLGLDDHQAVSLRAYTEPSMARIMNEALRYIEHVEQPEAPADFDTALILVLAMDEALARLPARPEVYYRGVDTEAMPKPLGRRFRRAHATPGEQVQYFGYTSAMIQAGEQYLGDIDATIYSRTARDIGLFSIKGEREIVIPRGRQFSVRAAAENVVYLRELEDKDMQRLPINRQFASIPESEMDDIDRKLIEAGRRHAEIVQEKIKRGEQPRADLEPIFERMQIEAEAGLNE